MGGDPSRFEASRSLKSQRSGLTLNSARFRNHPIGRSFLRALQIRSAWLFGAMLGAASPCQHLAAQATATPIAQASSGLLAQQAAYTFLGNSRGYDRAPGGIVLRAEHGAVLVEAIAGIGARIRVRFSDGTPSFPTPHSLATGDTAPSAPPSFVSRAIPSSSTPKD